MSREFIHLHVHSHYSLLEALPKLPDLLTAAKEDGQEALALTDNGNLYGAIEFLKESKSSGVKPIIGVDFFVAPRTRHDKEHRTDDKTSRLVLLAKNAEGYHNLIHMISKSFIEGFYYRPRIDRELIEKYKDNLICIVPSFAGEHARAFSESGLQENEAWNRAKNALQWHKDIFGADCYAEATHHPEMVGHMERMKSIVKLAKELDVPLVAAHDVYYLHQSDAVARELVIKIKNGGTLNRDDEETQDFSFITRAQANKYFADMPEAIENSAKIAEECTLELTLGKAIFPEYPIPPGTTDDQMLREKAEEGISERRMQDTPALRERMNYELGIIATKRYSSYFLIVSDLLRHAQSAGILTNTRGSAAGSLVSYLIGITTVDPIAFNMPFERFLNPERPSAPDIDMDIADNRRDDLINYARSKYGDDHVVQIGTFGTMMARAAVRDVARALGHSYGIGDAIAKLIPFGKQGFPVTIESALESTPDLETAYKKDPVTREVLDLAKKLEGNARHVGVHAAGVVIAPKPVEDFTPIQPDPKGGKTISQYDMYSIADEYGGVGLLKFDFLGLKNLSVLADAKQRVKDRLGVDVDFNHMPLDDQKVYDMLTRGETLGVFQMAGSGMTAYLKDLKPTVVHDLNAMVALYRPGPMAFIPDYIERKRDPSKVKYLDPRMETILKPTYGIIIYQDDVMMMAVQLAGYSWGEADKFRKAMGKKIPEEMAKQKDRFLSGCIERGMKPQAAQELWVQIETFAAYGFNKAHAASYGNLAYKTAYMKANFPVDYMASVLTADAGDVEQIHDIVAECVRMKIDILPPSVQESRGTFTVVQNAEGKDSIRFGLYSIKNFGTGVADSIIAARDDKGSFKDIGDFLARVTDKNLNKKSLEALIMCGALDDFGARGAMLAQIDTLLDFHKEHAKGPSAQASLFGAQEVASLTLKAAPEAPVTERLTWEKELLGLYVSGHPLDKFAKVLEKQTEKGGIKAFKEKFPRGVETVIGGYLESVRQILTKSKGEPMIFAQLSDTTGGVEVVAFPRTLKENPGVLIPGTCIMLKGKFSERNGEASFVIEKIKALK